MCSFDGLSFSDVPTQSVSPPGTDKDLHMYDLIGNLVPNGKR